VSTAGRRITPGDPGRGGYRPLTWTRGEPHQVRRDSGAPPLPEGWRSRARPLLVTAHLSDLHVTDHQSPARMELLDRFVDLDSPFRWELGIVGTYRPQELFTHQVVEAMVLAVNAELRGPVSGAPIDLAVVTGDATDNAQCNELAAYLDLLNGAATIVPDSGDLSRYDGVAGPDIDDTRYWHPEGGPDDLARRRYGFPEVPGLLDTMREPFLASGLAVPWLAVHGNHDLLMQGTVPSLAPWTNGHTSARKAVSPSPELDIVRAFRGFADCDPSALDLLVGSIYRDIESDPGRAAVTRAEHVRIHRERGGQPHGHGYTETNAKDGTAYYGFDSGPVRIVVLDTVDEHGGWHGSLDREQLEWLRAELTAAGDRPVVLLSHHPLETLLNDRNADGVAPRALAGEVHELVLDHPGVVLWLNGHTHAHRVSPIHRRDGSVGLVQVTTASHIDWPQQSRIVELLEVDGYFVVASTVLDSLGALDWHGRGDPLALAGLSRELAANGWQVRERVGADGTSAGTPQDRNVVLTVCGPALSAPADGW
jgi:metallophosphoesterase (TIGR03767 family)